MGSKALPGSLAESVRAWTITLVRAGTRAEFIALQTKIALPSALSTIMHSPYPSIEAVSGNATTMIAMRRRGRARRLQKMMNDILQKSYSRALAFILEPVIRIHGVIPVLLAKLHLRADP
jgi:hypothetical protein